MKIKLNCLLICFLLISSNMINTSSMANRVRLTSANTLKGKSHVEEKAYAHSASFGYHFSLLQANHEEMENSNINDAIEVQRDNIRVLEGMLANYREHMKNATNPTHDEETDGENVENRLQEAIAEQRKNLQQLKEQKRKNKKAMKEARKQETERAQGVERATLENNEVRQIIKDPIEEEHFEAVAGDGIHVEGNTERVQERRRNMTLTNNTQSFIQVKSVGAGADIANACTAGFMNVIPPTFAYKRGGDVGKSRFKCDGFKQVGALFHRHCKSNYRNVAGVCWEDCRGGYTDFGATCTKCGWSGWWPKCDTYWKSSYITEQITFFDGRVKCRDAGMYKSAALCYRDCGRENDGLVNCGIGACASSSAACIAGIVSMIAEFIAGLVSFITFVASFGASGAGGSQATVAGARAMLKQAGKKALNSFKFVQKIANNASFRKTMVKRAIEAAKKELKSTTQDLVRDKFIELQCRVVSDGILDETAKGNKFDIKSLDFTGIAYAVDWCKDPKRQDIECAKAVLNVISNVDPTGLVAMAGSVLQPIIDR